MDDIIDYEAIEKLAETIKEFANRLGKIIGELAEKIGEILGEWANNMDKLEKPKFKPVKSLIKPYKQPFIKVRYRARANL